MVKIKRKNYFSIISVVLIFTLMLSVFPISAGAYEIKKGDVNNDGEISISDATKIQSVLAGIAEGGENFEIAADYNSDGVVSVIDVTEIQRYIASSDSVEPDTTQEVTESETDFTQESTSFVGTEPTEAETNFDVTEQITEPTETETSADVTEQVTEPTEAETSADVTEQITEPTEADTTVEITEPVTEPTTQKVYPQYIKLNKSELVLGKGEKYTLITGSDVTDYICSFKSNKKSVASVSDSGEVIAVNTGSAAITCRTENGLEAVCSVTVKPMATSVSLNKTELTLGTGENYDLSSSIPGGTAAYFRFYSTSNANVADVEKGTGIVKAKSSGTANIYCTLSNGVKTACKVTVKPMANSVSLNTYNITLYKGKTYDLNSSIPSGTAAYFRFYSSSNTSVATVTSGGLVSAKKVGTAVVTCKLSNGVKKTCNVYVMPKSYKISGVPLVNQNKLPTGCETCSATMLLKFYGYNISETTFADKYLIKKNLSYSGSKIYGPDPNCAFVGNPYSSSGFGIYAPAMAKSMNSYLADKSYKAVSLKGKSLEYLAGKYIAQGQPVMVWATINMVASYKTTTWSVNYTDENAKYKYGSNYTWTANEHCLVLTGYNSNYYYFNDPWTNTRTYYKKSLVNTRYSELGKQAVVMEKR